MKRRQRMICILCLISVLCLLLPACGAKPAATERGTEETAGTIGTAPGQPDSSSAPDEQPQEAAADTKTIALADAHIFSEGIAWVRYCDDAGNTQFGWLHPDGSIDCPFPVDRVTQYGSDFSGGYSYVTTGDGYLRHATEIPDSYIILDQTGAVTAESPDDGCSYEILCGGDGVYLVKQSIRSMTQNEDRYGFLAGDGTWLYECAVCEIDGTHPLSAAEIDGNSDEVSFSYLGENIFLAEYSDRQSVFYNCITGKTYRITKRNSPGRNDDVQIYGEFSAGHIPVKIQGALYVLSTELELKPVAVDTSELVIYSDGIIFTSKDNWGSSGCVTEGKFYRLDGGVLVDLSEYALRYRDAYELYRFHDGYAGIVIHGNDNSEYLGIINTDGQFSFEPFKVDFGASYGEELLGELSDGRIACKVIEQDENSKRIEVIVVDTSGNITHSDYFLHSEAGRLAFHEGFAWDELNQCFLKTDGTALETYLKD